MDYLSQRHRKILCALYKHQFYRQIVNRNIQWYEFIWIRLNVNKCAKQRKKTFTWFAFIFLIEFCLFLRQEYIQQSPLRNLLGYLVYSIHSLCCHMRITRIFGCLCATIHPCQIFYLRYGKEFILFIFAGLVRIHLLKWKQLTHRL